MPRINVIVAAAPLDLYARGIAAGVAGMPEKMVLVAGRALAFDEVEPRLLALPESEPCAVVIVGAEREGPEMIARLRQKRERAVILRLSAGGDMVLHRVGLAEVLAKLCALVALSYPPATGSVAGRPLLGAAMSWMHEVIRDAVERQPGDDRDLPGLSLTPETVAASLKARDAGTAPHVGEAVRAADDALTQALQSALAVREAELDPLAAACRAFELSALEFRIVLLALAPELDPRYQVGLGLLLNNLTARVGTLGLFCAWLGEPAEVRRALSQTRNIARWRLAEGPPRSLPAADEPLRLDPFFAAWLLGDAGALARDPRLRGMLRAGEWPGWQLLDTAREGERARRHVHALRENSVAQWRVFAGTDPSAWRALLELGAGAPAARPIRIDGARAAGVDAIEEAGRLAGRMARLARQALIIDASEAPAAPEDDRALQLLFAAISGTRCRAAIVCMDAPRIARLLGPASFEIVDEEALPASGRAAAFASAGRELGLQFDAAEATAAAHQFPIGVDGVEHAMRIAVAKGASLDAPSPRERFVAACKDVASEGVSRFADRIDPTFVLDDVVLPVDRKRQLQEVVDSVRFAAAVLDGWKFRAQLPYGRGTTALFHGPSGTGKTMSALAVANALGIERGNGQPGAQSRRTGVPVLRVELSRLVSKFIGDTPKHIDAVFADARRSGSAILIDEADALLSRRSTEAKDSNDRHSAMEVAYLLQKIENLHEDGLVILTTNLKQNIDPAFMRRLRFVIDFPRPDAEAREKIWRRCLPADAHTLDAAAFRQLARKIDLTGGHIRQITLRAAFSAAAAHRKITLADIAYASRAELAKLGMPAAAIDVPELKVA
jgi:AAA+ superfamily predicted ATPase